MLSPNKILKRGMFIWLMVLLTIPWLWPILASWEGKYAPVVTQAKLENVESGTSNGLTFQTIYVSFRKTRNCEFVGLNWYTKHNVRIPVLFPPKTVDQAARSRSVGEQNWAGPWQLFTNEDIRTTHATVVHKCHPLWLTVSVQYTGDR